MLLTALGVGAQSVQHAQRVAFVCDSTPSDELIGPTPTSLTANAFARGLKELGYVDGRNISVAFHTSAGDRIELSKIFRRLVGEKVDVIVTTGIGVQAAQRVTTSIPIVGVISDPVDVGVASSLARPGGNITGLTFEPGTLLGKRLQLLREVVPAARRAAVLDWKYVNASKTPGTHVRRLAAESAARELGLAIIHVGVSSNEDLEAAFATIKEAKADMLMVNSVLNLEHTQRIITFARSERLPSIFDASEPVQQGALMSYAGDYDELWRRAAGLTDKILKGTKPGDLPFEQPTKYSLAINQTTAKALGLTIPKSVLLLADKVID
jgi:putative tryptophan/tyrosine transport system substrate-binding protein